MRIIVEVIERREIKNCRWLSIKQLHLDCVKGAPYTNWIKLDFAVGVILKNCLHLKRNSNFRLYWDSTKSKAFTT
jgi:hypothetical protein